MKTQISRKGFSPEKRYSGVYQQQGRMLTDSDWNEKVDIEKHRLIAALWALVGSGAPNSDGFITSTGTYEAPAGQLRWGPVVVGGVPAVVAPASGIGASDFDYGGQQDFPGAPLGNPAALYGLPDAGDFYLYLDVWDRAVTYLEDEQLRDSALQGADTCTRTRTMAQVKLCDTAIDPEDPAQNPQRGNATLTLHLREGSTDPDPCDPCAQEVTLHDTAANYLFRVEVHDVTHTPGGAVDTLTLKWSSENGAEQYEMDNLPEGFRTDSFSYELFSGTPENFASEMHAGRHFASGPSFPARGALHPAAAYPAEDTAKLIRRWDGYVALKQDAGGNWTITAGEDRGVPLDSGKAATEHAYLYIGGKFPLPYAENYLGMSPADLAAMADTGRIVVNLNTIVFQLELANMAFLAGDYWCTPVRSLEEETPGPLVDLAMPSGILHRYLKVARLTGGALQWEESLWEEIAGADGFKKRRLPFPVLTGLSAEDVGYGPPPCPPLPSDTRSLLQLLTDEGDNTLVLGGRKASVKRLLDMLLCQLNATHLPLDRENPAQCLIAGETTPLYSVQDGLNKLCDDIESLTAADIDYELPACPHTAEKAKTVGDLLTDLSPTWHTSDTVEPVLDALLCLLDARHLPLYKDAGLCDALRTDASVTTVQDALNNLCARKPSGCASYTVTPDANWQGVFGLLKPGEDASICFQAGYYELTETLVISGMGHLKITGAGPATRIRVTGRECALHFDGCKSVTVRDLFMDSLTVAPYDQARLMGVLTVSDAAKVSIENAALKCAAGTRLSATCLTVRSDQAEHSVRVRGCDFTTGHYQGAVLVLNATRAMIEDNTVNVATRPAYLTFETIVSDNVRKGVLRNQLVDRLTASYIERVKGAKSDIGNIAIKVDAYEVLFKSAVSEGTWLTLVQDDPPKAADSASAASAAAYVNRIIGSVVETPSRAPEFETRLNTFKTSVGETQYTQLTKAAESRQNLLTNLLVTSEPLVLDGEIPDREVILQFGDFQLAFDSVVDQGVWNAVVEKTPPASTKSTGVLKKYLSGLADQLLLDSAYRAQYGAVVTWYDHMKLNNPAAGSVGIVCAGKKATEIRIQNNNISGVTEAIRVAVSDGGYHKKSGSGLQADTVTIRGNRLFLRKPATIPRAQRAIMVGNCKHLVVENNRMTAAGQSATIQLYFEGLRVYGSLGRTALIRGNSFANCLTGILFKPLGATAADWTANLWIVSDNIAPGAETAVIPDSVRGYGTNLV